MGLLLVFVAAFLWGTVGVANRLMTGSQAVDPVACGLARTALGALVLIGAATLLRTPGLSWRRLARWPLAVFGVAGAVFQVCLFEAFARVGVTVTVAVTVCAPVALVAAVETARSGQAPSVATLAAIGVACGGVALAAPVVRELAPDAAATIDLGGVGLLALGSVAFAAVATSAREMSRDADALRVTGVGLAVTALALGVATLAQGGAPLSMLDLPARDLSIIAYTGVGATGVAYLAFVRGMLLSRSAASGLAATLIEPAVAALLAAAVLGERLTQRQTLGCLLMLAAMTTLFAAERRRGQPS